MSDSTTAWIIKQDKDTMYITFYLIVFEKIIFMFVRYFIYSVMFKYVAPDLMKPVTYSIIRRCSIYNFSIMVIRTNSSQIADCTALYDVLHALQASINLVSFMRIV